MDTQSARRFAPAHLGAIAVLSALLSMAGFAVLVSPANAKPEYLDAFNQKYGTKGSRLDTCNTCDPGELIAACCDCTVHDHEQPEPELVAGIYATASHREKS